CQGGSCKECVTVVPGKPQAQIGTHYFTFDHLYGGNWSPSAAMFEECIAPLVDGLFQGHNGTVLAYGQTGSGKTYTMGTGAKDSCRTGLIPQVMNPLFNNIEMLNHKTEFQLHVSFIEILKEEVKDLLDSTSNSKSDTVNANGHASKVLKERIFWPEATNEELSRELHENHSRCAVVEQCESNAKEGHICIGKRDGLRGACRVWIHLIIQRMKQVTITGNLMMPKSGKIHFCKILWAYSCMS
ncbi:unnamed protein product, partial [Ilex paraguariensis]